jgi:ATP synthase protein I
MADYARVVRRSAALCSVVAVVMVAICAGIAGTKGLYGALIGIGIVTAFFGISIVAVSRAAKVSPMFMMAVAMATYVIKILVFGIVVVALRHVTVFNPRLLGLTAVVLILSWSAAQVITMMRTKTLYVTPEEQQYVAPKDEG